MTTFLEFGAVALGGMAGCLARYNADRLGWFGDDKMMYTVAVNIVGSLLIGVVWVLTDRLQLNRIWYLLICTGCMGGLTTFSTFSLDTVSLIGRGMPLKALSYMFMTLAGGMTACGIGIWVTSKLVKLFG